jgi:hypothetical protein
MSIRNIAISRSREELSAVRAQRVYLHQLCEVGEEFRSSDFCHLLPYMDGKNITLAKKSRQIPERTIPTKRATAGVKMPLLI